MPLPASIHTSVGPSILSKASRLFAGTIGDVLSEALQNSRRAGASRVDIERIESDRGPVLRIRDDGCGIADPAKFLALGDSAWGEDIARSEDPAGMGVFSLAGRHVTVRSHSRSLGLSWQATITPEAWESGQPIDTAHSSIAKGTELEIDLPESWDKVLEEAVKTAARYYPVFVRFNGAPVPREDFLKGAERVEDWSGCRIGVFKDTHSLSRDQDQINFHGLTVSCRLPHVTEVDRRGWYAKVEIVDMHGIQLVLPARKEVVGNAALEALRESCEAAIFRTIARAGHHRLSCEQWRRAQALGVPLPEAAPWLYAWEPRRAEANSITLGDRIAGEPMILMPYNDAHIEQCVGRALARDRLLGATPVQPVHAFAGYTWYDALPCVAELSFRVTRDNGDSFDYEGDNGQAPPDLTSGRVREIGLELAIKASADSTAPNERFALPADLVIIPEDHYSSLDEVTVLLTHDSTITPNELAWLLENACFAPDDDSDSDSYHTQQSAFRMQARFTANMLLLGEDEAIIQRIRDAVSEHVSWLVPDERAVMIHTAGNKVTATFADNDDTPALAAAE